MNKKTQFITLTILFIIIVLLSLTVIVHVDSLHYNDMIQDSIISSEIRFQDYNFWNVLGDVLKVEFTRLFYDNNVNVTMSAELVSDYNPAPKLVLYNNFLPVYQAKLGISMNHSMSDLINDVQNNNQYVRYYYPSNVSVITDYSTNTIKYTNNTNLKEYIINVDFNGQVSDVAWNPTPVGNDIPVLITGPQGFTDFKILDFNIDYNLSISVSAGAIQDSVEINFDHTNNYTTTLYYGEVDDINSCWRNTCNSASTGKYDVEVKNGGRLVKFDGTGHLMSDDRVCETDAFIMNVTGATTTVNVTTKASTEISHVFSNPGESWYDSNGFKITFVNLNNGVYTFTISGVCNVHALNTVSFDFGSGATVTNPTNKYTTDRNCCESENFYQGVNVDVTTILDYDNDFKITSPYSNTYVNYSFSEFFASSNFT